MRRLSLLLLIVALSVTTALAQDDTGTDTTTTDIETEGPQTTVEIFFVACEDEGVMNLSGEAQPGFDVFYQLFSGTSGTGDELTSLRQINAEGTYAFSERIPYSNGRRVAPGSIASARVIIAEENTPETPAFETFVDDLQDSCNDPASDLQFSSDAGDVDEDDDTFGIARPDGGFLNNDILSEPEPPVVIGPRRQGAARSNAPGLVFALCDSFRPDADPGLIYDSDRVNVYWYWFADTAETLEQNLSRTQFQVTINQAPVPADTVIVSPVTARNGVFYRFYTVPAGNLRPGFYSVAFRQTWTEPVNDGFDNYGPQTANPVINSGCNFQVVQNPFGLETAYSGLYIGSD
ncbi:MAG: hypothetical protein AAF653_03955, partial [Chloroflexota bacterium]